MALLRDQGRVRGVGRWCPKAGTEGGEEREIWWRAADGVVVVVVSFGAGLQVER